MNDNHTVPAGTTITITLKQSMTVREFANLIARLGAATAVSLTADDAYNLDVDWPRS